MTVVVPPRCGVPGHGVTAILHSVRVPGYRLPPVYRGPAEFIDRCRQHLPSLPASYACLSWLTARRKTCGNRQTCRAAANLVNGIGIRLLSRSACTADDGYNTI